MSGLIGKLWWSPPPGPNARVTLALVETVVKVNPDAQVTLVLIETVVKP